MIERRLFAALLAAVVVMAGNPSALAHSVDELGQQLRDREKYFQPIDKQTPEFELEDPDGNRIIITQS